MFKELRAAYHEYEFLEKYECRTATITGFVIMIVYLGMRRLWCFVFDHAYESVSVDAENGREEIVCKRCGNSFTAQF